MDTLAYVTRSGLAILVALLLVVLGSVASRSAGAAFSDSDGDGVPNVAEEAFGSNAADIASTPEDGSLLLLFIGLNGCGDDLDNDLDGLIDGSDSGCHDFDGDNTSDATEERLGSDPHDDERQPEDARYDGVFLSIGFPFLYCANGNDDDGDTLVDADDPGCAAIDSDSDGFDDIVEKALGSDSQDPASTPEHAGINPGSCTDDVDNEGDGVVDAADAGCVTAMNDNLSDAIDIGALPFSHVAKVVSATTEPGERVPSCSLLNGSLPTGTIWYRFTSPVDLHAIVETTGSDVISAVSVWQPTPFGLGEVACNTPLLSFGRRAANRFAFVASAGVSYFIQVERYGSIIIPGELDLGRMSLHVEAVTPPANDAFAAAEAVDSLPFEATVDTVAASVEPSEPEATCPFQGYPANSIWYRFTPATDQYVSATISEGTDFGVDLAVFEGPSLAQLEQVACGGVLAFHAGAGHTYYMRAAGSQCQSPDAGAASFCLDSRSGTVHFHIETFSMPPCPPAYFSMSDPSGDADDDSHHVDITSVSVGTDSQYACLTVNMAPPIDRRDLRLWVEIDADSTGTSDGASHIALTCGPTGTDIDHLALTLYAGEGLLTSVRNSDDSILEPWPPAYFELLGSTGRLLIPLASIGGDDALRFAVEMSLSDTYDCVPNGGHISCAEGVCAYVPYHNGDADCSNRADSRDAALVLQVSAGLLPSVACPGGADVNGDGVSDSRDATLILQFVARYIARLPPENGCPPFAC